MANDTQGPRTVISTGIANQLKTISNADGDKWFDGDTVYEYPNFNSKGDPFAVIVPSNLSSDFDTNLDNTRIYEFFVLLCMKAGTKEIEDCYIDMRELEDDVLDLFDDDHTLGGVNSNLNSTRYILIDLLAAPSAWQRVTTSAKLDLIVAEIRLQAHINYDVQ